MDNLIMSGDQGKWVLSYCPSTGDEVVGSGWNKRFSTPTGQATWWHCPSCGGWHISTLSGESHQVCPTPEAQNS